METLSYFFIFLPGIQWNSGDDFGCIHVFLGIKTWNTAVIFIETGGRAVMEFIETRGPSAPGFNESITARPPVSMKPPQVSTFNPKNTWNRQNPRRSFTETGHKKKKWEVSF